MALTESLRSKLTDYAERSDRVVEPVFVGRERLFDLVERNVRRSRKTGSEGTTICLTGPPGVGKTAVMKALMAKCRERTFMDGKVQCIELTATDLHNPDFVLDQFSRAIPGFGFAPSAAPRLKSIGFGMSAAGVGGANLSTGLQVAGKLPSSTSFPSTLFQEASRNLLNDGHSFIIAVDKAQNIGNTPGQEMNGLLQQLHLGAGYPIVPLLIGQTSAPQALKNTISESRYTAGNRRPMNPLREEESRLYGNQTLDWLGVCRSAAARRRLVDWIVLECSDWPHHPSHAMKSVSAALVKANSLDLSDVDGAFVTSRIQARQLECYQSRFEDDVLDERPQSVAEVLASLTGKSVHGASLTRLVRESLREEERSMLDGMGPVAAVDATAFKNIMLEKGLVAPKLNAVQTCGFECPIDNLARFAKTRSHQLKSSFPDLRGA